ncbi:MAG: hypothetical protein M1339_05155 [Bacteroidetes bacterium]|nr:hypothetical protein [Bacteroidota bacterium]
MTGSQFYEVGAGDRLVDPASYPQEILEYLSAESGFVSELGNHFDRLIEIGCMNGRYLEWAVHHNKFYIGVDPVLRYIEAAQANISALDLPRDRFIAINDRAEHLQKITNTFCPTKSSADRSMAFFPFNSFGNADEPSKLVVALQKSRLRFLISSYQVSELASDCRRQYYLRAGCECISVKQSDEGVLFRTSNGLRSYAYDQEYLLQILRDHGATVHVKSLATIGVAYYGEFRR